MEPSRALQPSVRQNGKFVNQIPTSMGMSLKSALSTLRDVMKKAPDRKPRQPVPIEWANIEPFSGDRPAAMWFGHSTLLLRFGGKTILVDPMLGPSPSPVPFIGTRRYSVNPPLAVEELPHLDLVLITHDHYDHLDAGTVRKLRDKVKQYFVPIGVGAHLRKWGVDSSKIWEFDWWDERTEDELFLACTPARHFSGRGLLNRDSTLWCSWVLECEGKKLFLSGDSGYGPHFRAIGDKYGPFDVSFIECGQYDERWAAIHMTPEETVQAGLDVRGQVMIPIHWGAFTLAVHDWTDPVERVVRAGHAQHLQVSTPKIGELIRLDAERLPSAVWWK